jgi:soluble lytic murein transglycosylase-like protein
MKKLAIVIVIIFCTILAFWLRSIFRKSDLLDLTADGLGAERNEARNYNFLRTSGKFNPWLFSTDTAFRNTNRSLNGKNARWLVQTYDFTVENVANSLNIPRALLYAVMLVESGSVAAKANFNRAKYESLLLGNLSSALGPMQVKPITATETVQIAQTKGLVSEYHRMVLKRIIGAERTAELFTLKAGATRTFSNNKIIAYSGPKTELNNPELNIMIAGLKLAILIDNYGERNLHQVLYAYNQGDRTVIARNLKQYTTPADFQRNITGEGKLYIERLLSSNGALDIIINDLKIFK